MVVLLTLAPFVHHHHVQSAPLTSSAPVNSGTVFRFARTSVPDPARADMGGALEEEGSPTPPRSSLAEGTPVPAAAAAGDGEHDGAGFKGPPPPTFLADEIAAEEGSDATSLGTPPSSRTATAKRPPAKSLSSVPLRPSPLSLSSIREQVSVCLSSFRFVGEVALTKDSLMCVGWRVASSPLSLSLIREQVSVCRFSGF